MTAGSWAITPLKEVPMLGFVTEPARKGATHARRENIDPINLVQYIIHEFSTT